MQLTPRKYQAWLVLAGLMLVYAATNGIIVHTLPLIYPSLIDEFAWTSSQITLPATLFFVFGAITSPPAGVLLDRVSPRALMLVGIVGILISLFSFARIEKHWHMVVVFLGLGISLSLCGLTASMVILTRWFTEMRGRAIGLLLMASSIGGSIFPLVLGYGMESSGWRGAINTVSLVAVVMTVPALIFLVSDKPQKTHKDNIEPSEVANSISSEAKTLAQAPHSELGPSLRHALRKPTFYLLAIATGAMWFAIIALIQHQAIHLVKDIGVERSLVPRVFSVFFACSVIGKLVFGWMGDFINKETTMNLSIATFCLGIVVLTQVGADDTTLLFIYAVIAGIGFSGSFTCIQLLIAEHYSGPSYGKILAILVMIDSLAGGLGTRVIANIRDTSGNYMPAFHTLIALCLIAIICVAMVRWLNSSNPRGLDQLESPK